LGELYARTACLRLIQELPGEGLVEAFEVLEQLREFWESKEMAFTPKFRPKKVRVRIAKSSRQKPFAIGDD